MDQLRTAHPFAKSVFSVLPPDILYTFSRDILYTPARKPRREVEVGWLTVRRPFGSSRSGSIPPLCRSLAVGCELL
jgi:hypothetical protein